MKKIFESIRVLGWCCQTSRAPMILCAILAVCWHTTGAVEPTLALPESP